MPTYVYETVPAKGGRSQPKTFEIRQSILDPPLTSHPVTGEPVRRVISGGAAILTPSAKAPAPRSGGGCCGGGSCGCSH